MDLDPWYFDLRDDTGESTCVGPWSRIISENRRFTVTTVASQSHTTIPTLVTGTGYVKTRPVQLYWNLRDSGLLGTRQVETILEGLLGDPQITKCPGGARLDPGFSDVGFLVSGTVLVGSRRFREVTGRQRSVVPESVPNTSRLWTLCREDGVLDNRSMWRG